MQATLRLHRLRPLRLRFVRSVIRYFRARLREESPVIDRIEPAVADRSGFSIRAQM
jgi:hypothetical protein